MTDITKISIKKYTNNWRYFRVIFKIQKKYHRIFMDILDISTKYLSKYPNIGYIHGYIQMDIHFTDISLINLWKISFFGYILYTYFWIYSQLFPFLSDISKKSTFSWKYPWKKYLFISVISKVITIHNDFIIYKIYPKKIYSKSKKEYIQIRLYLEIWYIQKEMYLKKDTTNKKYIQKKI